MTAWPFQSTGTIKEDTARQTTFSSTMTTSNLIVSYRTEGNAFSADLKYNDVFQMTNLPTEMILSKNDLFNHLVKISGSFLVIILVINYILNVSGKQEMNIRRYHWTILIFIF